MWYDEAGSVNVMRLEHERAVERGRYISTSDCPHIMDLKRIKAELAVAVDKRSLSKIE
jgi:hypothetical protein